MHITKKEIAAPSAAFLASLLTFLIFLPALGNGFINWDDPAYVTQNPVIRSINAGSLKTVFTAPSSCNWHPLTVLSHALDYSIWGLIPWGHHLTSITLHSLNTFMVAVIVIRLAGLGRRFKEDAGGGVDVTAVVAGLTAALFFGIHPAHVESVAWVSERKDLLCAFFFLLSLLFYLKYFAAKRRKTLYYAGALLSFVLALLSKPMAISLPVVLLILDFYPLERLRLGARSGIKRAVLEKAPFFLLSAVSVPVTLWAQASCKAITSLEAYPMALRILAAVRAYIFYLYKMALPVGLAPYYPRPVKIDLTDYTYPLSAAVFIAITAFCIIGFKKHKMFLSAWAYYLITLLPVIGIVQVGGQAAADRYTYLPSIAPFLAAGLGMGRLIEKYFYKRSLPASIAAAALMTAVLGPLTIRQTGIWKDPVTFWSYEIKQYPKSVPIAYINRAMVYEDEGRLTDALRDYTAAIAITPGYADTYIHRGNIFNAMREHKRAIVDFDAAIRLDPGSAAAYNNRGISYKSLGDGKKAIEDLKTAIALDPSLPDVYENLASAYSDIGDTEAASEAYDKASKLRLGNRPGL